MEVAMEKNNQTEEQKKNHDSHVASSHKFWYSVEDFQFSLKDWEGQGKFARSKFDELLQGRWDAAMAAGFFKYGLEKMETKVLPGRFGLVAQLNEKRFVERRKPEKMLSVVQPFDAAKFNFTKVKQSEVLLELCCRHRHSSDHHVIIINISPLEYGNSLIVPNINSCLPQVLTQEAVELGMEVSLLSSHRGFRVGFNSLCALASVNHLHYHVWYVEYPSPLETLDIVPICRDVFEVKDYPTRAFVFQLQDLNIQYLAKKIHLVTSHLTKNEIAHNLSIFRAREPDNSSSTKNNRLIEKRSLLRIFLWSRASVVGAKDETAFNTAVCEFGGQLPIRNREWYDSMCEEKWAAYLQEVTLSDQEFKQLKEDVIKILADV